MLPDGSTVNGIVHSMHACDQRPYNDPHSAGSKRRPSVLKFICLTSVDSSRAATLSVLSQSCDVILRLGLYM